MPAQLSPGADLRLDNSVSPLSPASPPAECETFETVSGSKNKFTSLYFVGGGGQGMPFMIHSLFDRANVYLTCLL